jgi:hypothetical protein
MRNESDEKLDLMVRRFWLVTAVIALVIPGGAVLELLGVI